MKRRSRRSSSRFGNILTPIIAGAGAGLALNFIAPYLNGKVPNLGPIPASAVTAIGVGAGVKMLLRKDPMKIPTAMMILGGTIAAQSLLGGSVSSGAGASAYANEM